MYDKVIAYTQTIKQYHQIIPVGALREKLFTEDSNNPRNVLVEMLHSCTDKEKKVIFDTSNPQYNIRVLIPNIVFAILYHRLFIVNIQQDIKDYVKASKCRKAELMKPF